MLRADDAATIFMPRALYGYAVICLRVYAETGYAAAFDACLPPQLPLVAIMLDAMPRMLSAMSQIKRAGA